MAVPLAMLACWAAPLASAQLTSMRLLVTMDEWQPVTPLQGGANGTTRAEVVDGLRSYSEKSQRDVVELLKRRRAPFARIGHFPFLCYLTHAL